MNTVTVLLNGVEVVITLDDSVEEIEGMEWSDIPLVKLLNEEEDSE